jgi:hypothetical protein
VFDGCTSPQSLTDISVFASCLSTNLVDFAFVEPLICKMSYTNGTSNRGGYEQIGPEAPLLNTGPSSDGSKVFLVSPFCYFCIIGFSFIYTSIGIKIGPFYPWFHYCCYCSQYLYWFLYFSQRIICGIKCFLCILHPFDLHFKYFPGKIFPLICVENILKC